MTNNVYDPSKRYTWGPDSQFTINGNEFGLILNTIRAVISTPEAQKVILAQQANEIIEKMVARAVENGVAVEFNEESNG